MTESDLIQAITANGWEILQTRLGDKEANIQHKAVAVCKSEGSVLLRQWLSYYVKDDGLAFWQERDPFPPAPAATFEDRLRAKLSAVITGGTIKAAYIEKLDARNKRAIVIAVLPDNSFATYLVYEDADTFTLQKLTGMYPI